MPVLLRMDNGTPKLTDFVTNNPDGLSPTDALRSIGALYQLPYITDNTVAKLSASKAAIAVADEVNKLPTCQERL